MTASVHITKDEVAVTVNATEANDDNVVVSFTFKGRREVLGLSPREARKMAWALLEAADAVEFGGLFV